MTVVDLATGLRTMVEVPDEDDRVVERAIYVVLLSTVSCYSPNNTYVQVLIHKKKVSKGAWYDANPSGGEVR